MGHSIRKLTFAAAAALATLATTAGSAFAFECYNATRSEQGNQAAAGAPALVSLEEALVMFCGVDPDDTADIVEQMAALGYRTDILINGHTIMASGLEKSESGEEKLHDGQAIDHLSEQFFIDLATIEPGCA
jgi:hypothetical protein